jgi:hypothetical protein
LHPAAPAAPPAAKAAVNTSRADVDADDAP